MAADHLTQAPDCIVFSVISSRAVLPSFFVLDYESYNQSKSSDKKPNFSLRTDLGSLYVSIDTDSVGLRPEGQETVCGTFLCLTFPAKDEESLLKKKWKGRS